MQELGKAQCKATSKRSGERCKNAPVTGREVCRMHGGKTPAGVGVKHYSHGRYSKYFPERLKEKEEHASKDKELLALDAEIHLVTALIYDSLEKIDTGESSRVWRELRRLSTRIKTAVAKQDMERMFEISAEVADLIDRAEAINAAREDALALIDQRRKLTESERKRLVEGHKMLTADQAMVLVNSVVQSVRRHVDDPGILAAISSDVVSLVNNPGS